MVQGDAIQKGEIEPTRLEPDPKLEPRLRAKKPYRYSPRHRHRDGDGDMQVRSKGMKKFQAVSILAMSSGKRLCSWLLHHLTIVLTHALTTCRRPPLSTAHTEITTCVVRSQRRRRAWISRTRVPERHVHPRSVSQSSRWIDMAPMTSTNSDTSL